MTEATAPAWPIRMSEVCAYWEDATRRGASTALRRFAGSLTPEHLEIIRAAGDVVRTWYLLAQTRLTLTHGDPRVDNVLFEQHEGGTRAVLIDWQVTGLRNPMYDIGYLPSGSLAPEDRRAHERELIDHYLQIFAQGESGYGVDEALADYRAQLLAA